MVKRYPAFIHKERGSDFGVSFPDFPGCVSAGATPEEAHALAEEALQLHVDGMVEEGEKIPDPTSLNEAYKQSKKVGAVVVSMIPVRLPARAKRINITIEGSLLEDIDQAASSHGLTRSAFLAQGAALLIKTQD